MSLARQPRVDSLDLPVYHLGKSNRPDRLFPCEVFAMVIFVVLLDFTDQGIKNLNDSPHRADVFKEFAEKQ